jgi:hypothetical protein
VTKRPSQSDRCLARAAIDYMFGPRFARASATGEERECFDDFEARLSEQFRRCRVRALKQAAERSEAAALAPTADKGAA